jgi:hypothetical protein
MPLFACDAAILRARCYIEQGSLAQGEACRERAAKLVDEQRYRAGAGHYGRGAVALAVLDAELALATGNNAIDAFNAAVAAVVGMPHVNSGTGQTIDGGWFGYLSRLDAIAPNDHVGFIALTVIGANSFTRPLRMKGGNDRTRNGRGSAAEIFQMVQSMPSSRTEDRLLYWRTTIFARACHGLIS